MEAWLGPYKNDQIAPDVLEIKQEIPTQWYKFDLNRFESCTQSDFNTDLPIKVHSYILVKMLKVLKVAQIVSSTSLKIRLYKEASRSTIQ
jgi:hypothetical protein